MPKSNTVPRFVYRHSGSRRYSSTPS